MDKQAKEKELEIAERVREIISATHPMHYRYLDAEDVLFIVRCFKEEAEKNGKRSIDRSVSDSNNQEIGETETPIRQGNDAAIERCPGDSYD